MSWVYFLLDEEAQEVKIGVSTAPVLRQKALESERRKELTPLGWVAGRRETERAMHERFASDRIKGEWFRYSEEIKSFLETTERPPFPGHEVTPHVRVSSDTARRLNILAGVWGVSLREATNRIIQTFVLGDPKVQALLSQADEVQS